MFRAIDKLGTDKWSGTERVFGEALLTVTEVVEDTSSLLVTGWFYSKWENNNKALMLSLLENYSCNETDTCECSTCLIGDEGWKYEEFDDQHEEVKLVIEKSGHATSIKVGARILVEALFSFEPIDGAKRAHEWTEVTATKVSVIEVGYAELTLQ